MAINAAELDRLSEGVRTLLGQDVSALNKDQFLTAFEAVASLGKLTDSLRAKFAAEVDRRSGPLATGASLARSQGFGNAQKMIEKFTGGTAGSAQRDIRAGKAFELEFAPPAPALAPGKPAPPRPRRFPFLADAVARGDLSAESAAILSEALGQVRTRLTAEALVELESGLVTKVLTQTAGEVRRTVSRAIARLDRHEHERREKRHYEDRYVAWKEDHQGVVTLSGKMDAVTFAPIRAVLEQVVTRDMRKRRSEDPQAADTRSVGQMRADALFEMCRHALGCKETKKSGVRTTVIVRIDQRDLNAGEGLGSIDGVDTPVSVGQLRRLAGDAGIVPEVLGSQGEVLDLGRRVRHFTDAQRLALIERDGGCARCHAPPEHCEAHHIVWWSHGGHTDLWNGIMLCTRCHHDIHKFHWEINAGPQGVEFIPPPDASHLAPVTGGRNALELESIAEIERLNRPPDDFADDGPFDGTDDTTAPEWFLDLLREERSAALV